MKMFYSRCVHTDVTCVQIVNNFLIAGVGGFLHLYALPANNFITKKNIFEGQNIFGIKPNCPGTNLIVYGGKKICLVSFEPKNMNLKKTCNDRILSDWILDAKWIEDDTKIVTAFMNNKITISPEDFTSPFPVKCEERCILYSAHISYDHYNQLLITAGTVFSEVLLWKPFYRNEAGLSPVLIRLNQHKGVIFSLDCNLENGLICSASDDRSAILWKVINPKLLSDISPTNYDTVQIKIACQVYGHLSRVFRCLILKDFFLTAGEDSLIIMWDFQGKILRKIHSHQGGPVWSLCCIGNIICSGRNDGALSTFKSHPSITKETVTLPKSECPKIIGILNSGSMVCLSERGVLYYHIQLTDKWEQIAEHTDLQKYSVLQISPCKKMLALAGYEGQIYIYSATSEKLKLLFTHYVENKSRIFSFHWINCKMFLVSQKDGLISLYFIYRQQINYIQSFTLPPAKERWPTCACAINDHFIIGDRKGNIHNFKIGNKNLINSIEKSHSYLGVTKLYLDDGVIISLGKDGFLKRYRLLNGYLETIDSNKTNLSWLTALEHNYLLGFCANDFIISDFKLQRILFKTPCGGGHRSWDYLTMTNDFTFSFVKKKAINTFRLDLDEFTPVEAIEGFHSYEINCLKILNINSNHVIVSGGEDTILRISVMLQNDSLNVLQRLKVHLSSIRAINIRPCIENDNTEYLLFTGGGRAQIICWHLQIVINNLDDLKIICKEKHNFYEPLDKGDAETRIMDLSTETLNDRTFLLAGCSNGFIKVFSLSPDMRLVFLKSVLHSHNSITKIIKITHPNSDLVGSLATDGRLVFWSLSDICNSAESTALCSYKIHQSGVTSCSYLAKDKNMTFLSGGDDNSVILTKFVLSKDVTIARVKSVQNQGIHCAQITGAYLTDNYFVTSSIDQRIVVSKWACEEDQLNFEMVGKYNTAIADPQGLEIVTAEDCFSLYIYGNGFEHLEVKLHRPK